MKKWTPVLLAVLLAVVLPGTVLSAQVDSMPTLLAVDFSTSRDGLAMRLAFDRAPSSGDIDVKWVTYPERLIVAISGAVKSEELREGVVYQDILSDGSGGVDKIELTYAVSHDKVAFIAHPLDGLAVDVSAEHEGVVYVKYWNTLPGEPLIVKPQPKLPPLAMATDEGMQFADYFSLDTAELRVSPEAEGIIRAYFAKDEADKAESTEPVEGVELLAGRDVEPATGRLVRATYRIQVGDKLALGVAGEPELEVAVQVRPDGFVSFPIIGDVYVDGKTADETRRTIKRMLQPYYNYDLVVDVIITEFTPERVYLLGKVYEAGPHPYIPGMTMLDIISNYDERDADITKVKLLRGDEVYPVNLETLLAGDIRLNYELEPGDYIVFPTKVPPKASVMGKVKFPGQYPFDEGQRLFDLIGIASGFDDRCDIKNILVIRLDEQGLFESHICDLLAYQKEGAVDQNILIEDGDIIIVPEVGRANWDRFLRGLSAVNTVAFWARFD